MNALEILSAVVAGVLFVEVGQFHYADDLISEATAKAERVNRAVVIGPTLPQSFDATTAQYVEWHTAFSRPLPCDATVSQRTTSKWDGPRCYIATSTKDRLSLGAR